MLRLDVVEAGAIWTIPPGGTTVKASERPTNTSCPMRMNGSAILVRWVTEFSAGGPSCRPSEREHGKHRDRSA